MPGYGKMKKNKNMSDKKQKFMMMIQEKIKNAKSKAAAKKGKKGKKSKVKKD